MDEQRAHQRAEREPSLLAYLTVAELERLAAALVEMLISGDEQRRQSASSDQEQRGA